MSKRKWPTLYKRSNNEKIDEWSIFTDGPSFYTVSGQVDGKKTTSSPTVCKPKNVGRSNATTAAEQAVSEAEAKYVKKIEKGYTQDIKKVDSAKSSVFQVMLAQSFEDYEADIDYSQGVYSDRKYNGQRCRGSADGLWSRSNKPIVSCPHIFKAVSQLFEQHPKLFLDGELYSHTYRHKLNRILELTRKTKPTAEDLKASADMVEYHIYDGFGFNEITAADKFSVRKAGLHELLQKIPGIVVVKSTRITSKKELDAEYKKYLEEEYEGQMVRLDAEYEHKRSKHLLKRKEWMDAEFEVLEVIEGEGGRAGTVGAMLCKLPNGETFKSNVKGDFEFITKIWKERNSYVGKKATVEFFAYSEYGVPQFPYVIAFRDDV